MSVLNTPRVRYRTTRGASPGKRITYLTSFYPNNLAVIYYYRKEFQQSHRELLEAEKSGFPVNEEFKRELKKALEKQDK